MIKAFLEDDLNKFYVPSWGYVPDLAFCSKNYDLVYNEFTEFSLEAYSGLRKPNLAEAAEDWIRYEKGQTSQLLRKYTDSLYQECMAARYHATNEDLETAILDWVQGDYGDIQIALLGGYGTGKSSFARRLAHKCALMYEEDHSFRIPLLIELKEFGSHQDIQGLITHELINRHRVLNGSFATFQSLNKAGRFFIILDGFDEMKQGMTIDAILFNFDQIFQLNLARSKILLCGRPTLFDSQAEQSRVLRGSALSKVSHAKFVQIKISPPDFDEIFSIIINYTKVKAPEVLSRVRSIVRQLKKTVHSARSSELIDLVSRPVHLPMLVSILQRRDVTLEELDRALLYREFIDAIIERETLKRRAEFQNSYSSSVRRAFVRDLAAEMWRRGEQRAIRTGEIPVSLLEPFVGSGRTIEAVRRDFVASCFFERKLPDILVVPHKSFLEYLVAEYIVVSLDGSQDDQNISVDGIELTGEIVSFILELLRPSHWHKILTGGGIYRDVLKQWVALLRSRRGLMKPHIEDALAECLVDMPPVLLEGVVSFYETNVDWGSPRTQEILYATLLHESDLVAVHAFRALQARGKLSMEAIQLDSRSLSRIWNWWRRGWVTCDKATAAVLEQAGRVRLVTILTFHGFCE